MHQFPDVLSFTLTIVRGGRSAALLVPASFWGAADRYQRLEAFLDGERWRVAATQVPAGGWGGATVAEVQAAELVFARDSLGPLRLKAGQGRKAAHVQQKVVAKLLGIGVKQLHARCRSLFGVQDWNVFVTLPSQAVPFATPPFAIPPPLPPLAFFGPPAAAIPPPPLAFFAPPAASAPPPAAPALSVLGEEESEERLLELLLGSSCDVGSEDRLFELVFGGEGAELALAAELDGLPVPPTPAQPVALPTMTPPPPPPFFAARRAASPPAAAGKPAEADFTAGLTAGAATGEAAAVTAGLTDLDLQLELYYIPIYPGVDDPFGFLDRGW